MYDRDLVHEFLIIYKILEYKIYTNQNLSDKDITFYNILDEYSYLLKR